MRVEAEQVVWHARPASAVLQLPPAGVLWLVPDEFEGPVRRRPAASSAAETATDTAGGSEDGSAADPQDGQEAVEPTDTGAAAVEPDDEPGDTARPNNAAQ